MKTFNTYEEHVINSNEICKNYLDKQLSLFEHLNIKEDDVDSLKNGIGSEIDSFNFPPAIKRILFAAIQKALEKIIS